VTESVALRSDPNNAPMAEYRAYLIGDDGHFYDAVSLVCADDAEAMEKAKRLAVGHDVELWQLDRKIATLNHKPE
jgi:hypothetical protein